MKNSIHGIEIDYVYGQDVETMDGRTLIDFTSGIFAANLGMHNMMVYTAISEQLKNCMHSYQFDTPIKRAYLKALCEFTGFESAYMFSSGTEATEAAYKIARKHTGKPGVWGLNPAFHGKTLGAQIAAGRENDWRNQTPGDKTGCLIFEPYVAATAKFHEQKTIDRILSLVKEFNLILIADEIQAGFGRTGKLFGYQHYPEVKPDIVCIGKGMCNGFPASAILGPAELIDNPLMDLSSTNGGNPLACAAGMAVIEYFKRWNILEMSAQMGHYFHAELSKLEQPVQGRGMVASIWFPTVQEADKAVVDLCAAGLLVVHTKGQTIKLGPPLNISKKALDDGIAILRRVLS